jgi:hypothetical protein
LRKNKGVEVQLKNYLQIFSVLFIDAAKGVEEQFEKMAQHQRNFQKIKGEDL